MFSKYNINVSNNIIDLTYNNGIDYTESKFAKNAHYYFGTNIYIKLKYYGHRLLLNLLVI